MLLKNDKIMLRHFKSEDIEKHIDWVTVETEWKEWDAPWEWLSEADDIDYIERRKSLLDKPTNSRLMIETLAGELVGEVNSYYIDGDCEKLAVGIGIPPLSARRKGHAYAALTLFMEHLFKTRDVLYTQTWSGNMRMIALAEKIGFKEVRRLKDLREVNGEKYDGLTFAVTKAEFDEKRKLLMIKQQNIEIKKFTDVDFDAFAQMVAVCWVEDYKETLYENPPIRMCNRMIQSVKDGFTYLDLLHLDGNPIGFVMYQVDHPESDWCEKEGFGFIREMYIRKDQRKHGYGKILANHAENELKKLLVPHIYLTSDDAIEFWLSVGYVDTGEISKFNGGKILIKEV